jgi:hypothetical protein
MKSWPPEDWGRRLDALLTAGTPSLPMMALYMLKAPPPAPTAPQQCRLALRWASSERDEALRAVAANLRALRSGDPARDVALFAWDAARPRPLLMSWLLELAGDAGDRTPLVDAAAAAGLVAPGLSRELRRPLDRPAWADADPAWRLAEVRDLGTATVAGDGLVVADPVWEEPPAGPVCAALAPGEYAVALAVAHHPLIDAPGAAALVVGAADRTVSCWEPLGACRPENGTLVLGPARAVEIARQDFERAAHFERARELLAHRDDAATLFYVSVAVQHPACAAWAGKADDGTAVGLVVDLGLIGLDPVADPLLPWA